MRDSLINRRDLLRFSGASVMATTVGVTPASAQTDASDDGEIGRVNSITGFENPQPISVNSDRFQLVTPANQLMIDVETDDIIDLVFEWDESVSVEYHGHSSSGSAILTRGDSEFSEHRAIIRGEGNESLAIEYDKLSISGLDTSDVTPGDEVTVEVSARQADSEATTEDFEDVVSAVDDGTFEPEATIEATFEVTQGTLISINDEATANFEPGENVDHAVAFDIDQLRDEDAGRTPAGPAEAIGIHYNIEAGDGSEFDLKDDNVTLGEAASSLDLEVVDSPYYQSAELLEIKGDDTLEDTAELEAGDTVTVEFGGLDVSDFDIDQLSEADSWVEVGLHGSATLEPIVSDPISPLSGPYTIATGRFEFGESDFEFTGGNEQETDGGAGVLFRQATEATDNPLVVAGGGTATAGLGYLAYRSFQSDDTPETKKETKSTSRTDKSTAGPGKSTAVSPSIEQYSELNIGETIERHQNVKISHATKGNKPVWVLSPESDGDTIDTDQFNAFLDRVDPWTNMDDHINLLPIYGNGTEPLPWVAVEPVDGPSLQECTGDLTTDESLKLLAEACEAVHHVQRYGLAYEHLSPNSILVDDTNATLRGVVDHVTADNVGYELPDPQEDSTAEQADVYRLGALAYEVLTGSQPTDSEPTPPSEQNVSLPPEVDEKLLKALAIAPDDRYETVLHLRDELQEVVN